MMIVGDKIDDPDLITELVWAGSNLSRTSEIGWPRAASPTRGGGAGTPVRRLPSLRRTADWSSALSLPRVWRLESISLKWCGVSGILTLGSTVVGNDSKVVDGGGSTFPASTAVHDLTWVLLTPTMGSRASSFSPRDHSLVQLLWEAANWFLQRSLRVLGFNLKQLEIRALWPPIYRGFCLISKWIRSRSYFDPSIKLISALVRFNPKGRLPGQYEFGMNSVGRPSSGRWRRASWAPLGRSVACRAAPGGIPLGRYASHA
jgi:hypothetical protein